MTLMCIRIDALHYTLTILIRLALKVELCIS
jgi:hypothetical protein